MEDKSLMSLADADRRSVLQLLVGIAATTMVPGSALADEAEIDGSAWPKDAFDQKGEDKTLKALYGKTASMSDQISVDLPEIAENGAVVPIAIKTTLPKITSIAILIPANPGTLIAAYKIPDGTKPEVASRIKMAKTSTVIVVAESNNALFMTKKDVKVTLGGCG